MRLSTRVFLAYFLIVGAACWMLLDTVFDEIKPGVRQSMEDTLADTAHVLAALAVDDMRAAAHGGTPLADSPLAARLALINQQPIQAQIWGQAKTRIDTRITITNTQGIVVFDSSGVALGADHSRWNDVYLTLRGRYGVRSSKSDPADDNSTVMHVAAPIRDGNRLLGVLTVAKPNQAVQPFIDRSRRRILQTGGLVLGLSLLVGGWLSWRLSRSMRRLAQYAHAVSRGERVSPPSSRSREMAALGEALETMRRELDGKQYVEHYVQTLTHEMKSPLTAIRGAAELLDEDMPRADRSAFLGHIRSQSERLQQIVDRMLAQATVEQLRSLPHAQPLDLVALIGRVIDSRTLSAAHRQIRLDGPSMPASQASHTPPTVRGDRFLLEQALGNLLDNALDFAPDGSTIRLSLEPQGADWVCVIQDQGPGIPDFALPHVFERFYSLPRPRHGARSTGLGLSFVREVASLHQGGISLHNATPPASGVSARLRLSSDITP